MSRSRPLYYLLDQDRSPVPTDVDTWTRMFKDAESRRVASTELGEATISTVFLGMDHGWDQDGPPILFETLVIGGPCDGDMWRYATWAEAEAGHAAAVEAVRSALADGSAPS